MKLYLSLNRKKNKKQTMRVYQILKVTNEGEYFVGMRSTLKDAIKCAKMVVANADIAPMTYQCTSKHEVKNRFFYASVRLLQSRYEIDAEIWKTDVYHEQAGS